MSAAEPAGARAPVSVCIIACNEEGNLPRCLESAAWADEVVVVVDTRSTDATEALAREAGARTILHAYEGNIEQKNFALGEAKHDWVLSLDADEALTPELTAAVQSALSADGPDAGYELNRLTWHLGRWIRHGEFYPDWQMRLFRRSQARVVGVNPHGRVELVGRAGRIDGDLLHYSYRDLADQIARIQDFSRIQAAAMWAAGRRASLFDLGLRPPLRFLRCYLLKQGIRDGGPGFVIAAATAFHVFLKYAKLWELGRNAGASAEQAAGKARRP
ncbi:MAG: glycosyltransferase family 2 protein [Deltaproteobacteria bacterium]|nr:glycosyltransferase family 2 protein [Deltaproteobacteria bacterium]MBW2444749.1 glycosyltransferase family 2 protein [Deltaproteobacteria bacterium]